MTAGTPDITGMLVFTIAPRPNPRPPGLRGGGLEDPLLFPRSPGEGSGRTLLRDGRCPSVAGFPA